VDGINKILVLRFLFFFGVFLIVFRILFLLSVYYKNKEIGFAMQYSLYRETEKKTNNLGKKGK
jgi:hypothetical protein